MYIIVSHYSTLFNTLTEYAPFSLLKIVPENERAVQSENRGIESVTNAKVSTVTRTQRHPSGMNTLVIGVIIDFFTGALQ